MEPSETVQRYRKILEEEATDLLREEHDTRKWDESLERRSIGMSIRSNRVKQKLAAGETVYVLSGLGDPELVDQLGSEEFDGVWLEGEHSRSTSPILVI